MKKYFLIFSFWIFAFFLSLNVVGATTAIDNFNAGRDKAANEMGYETGDSESLAVTIGKGIKFVLTILGIVFLVLMIYGGFKWMKAMGRESDIEAAKKIIENAIIGLVLVFGAYALTIFIASGLASKVTAP